MQLEVQNEDWDRLKTGALPLKASQVLVEQTEGPAVGLDQQLTETGASMVVLNDKMGSVESTMQELLQLGHRFDRLDQLGRTTADTQSRLLVVLKKIGVDPTAEGGNTGGLLELKERMEAYTEEFGQVKEDVDTFRRQLVEKADMVKVEARIERKFEEVSSYLHQAIEAANEDEAEFRTIATTLQETVKELMNTKADRSDLLELHGSKFGSAGGSSQMKTLMAKLGEKLGAAEVEELVHKRISEALRHHAGKPGKAAAAPGKAAGAPARRAPAAPTTIPSAAMHMDSAHSATMFSPSSSSATNATGAGSGGGAAAAPGAAAPGAPAAGGGGSSAAHPHPGTPGPGDAAAAEDFGGRPWSQGSSRPSSRAGGRPAPGDPLRHTAAGGDRIAPIDRDALMTDVKRLVEL